MLVEVQWPSLHFNILQLRCLGVSLNVFVRESLCLSMYYLHALMHSRTADSISCHLAAKLNHTLILLHIYNMLLQWKSTRCSLFSRMIRVLLFARSKLPLSGLPFPFPLVSDPSSLLLLLLPQDSATLPLHLSSCLAQSIGNGDPVNSIVRCLDSRYK